MNQKMGYILIMVLNLCVLCSCKQDVTNEFTENVKSSIGEYAESEHVTFLMGEIIDIKNSTITVSLLEREDNHENGEKFGPPSFELDKQSSSEPRIDNSLQDKSSKKSETSKANGEDEEVPPMPLTEIGKELEVVVEEDTELSEGEEGISFEDLEKGDIVYLEFEGKDVHHIRVSRKSYWIRK